MNTLLTEARVFISRISGFRSILLHFALLVAFGIFVPRMKGLDFLDSRVLAAYACLGLIFSAPATAQAFEGSAAPSFAEAGARIVISVAYGEIVALALLGGGMATIYVTNRGHYVPTPDWPSVGKSILFGFGAAAMLASIAAWLTLRFSRKIAMICLRLAFFGALVLFYYKGQSLPDVGMAWVVACIAFAGIFLTLVKKECR